MKRSLLFLSFLLSLVLTPALAQQKSKAVQNLEKQRKAALEAVKKTEKELDKTRQDRTKKQGEVKLLRRKEEQQKKVVNLLDLEIKTYNKEIDSLARTAIDLQGQEEEKKKAYERSVVAVQKRKNSTNGFLFILSSKDFDQALRRVRFISQYATAHERAAEALRETRIKIEDTKDHLLQTKKNKSDLLVVREREYNKLSKMRKKAGTEVANLKGQEKKLQQQKKKYQQRAASLNRKIEQQIAKEIEENERKAREASKKGGVERKAATKGGYEMTAEERKLSGSFASNRGNLLVPVNGPYTIVSHFGVQRHKLASKVQTNNSGVDLSVPPGTKVRAVFDGTVSSVFVVSGYNNSIIIRHGNYLTVYANVTNLQVKKGQRVTTGQTLGTVATSDGNTILHFQLWHERTKQNPELWIR